MNPSSKFVMAAVAAACLTTVAVRAQTPAQAPKMEAYPAIGAPVAVKLIDAGAQPRKALRYSVPATFKSGIDMTMTMNMTVNAMGTSIPLNMGVKTTGNVAVTGVTNGDTTYTMAFTDVSMDAGADANPIMATAFQAVQSAILALKGTATISAVGVVKSAKMDASGAGQAQQMMGELTSMLENLATAFPDEAVGVGAKWETRQSLLSAGQYSFMKKITEIVSIDGSVVKLKFTSEQVIPAQTMTNPAFPMEMQLDASKGSGSGTADVRLDSLIPKGESTSTSTMSMSMQGQAMSMESTTKMTIAPATVK